jgi:DNA-binding GntR family transcriptional regulator
MRSGGLQAMVGLPRRKTKLKSRSRQSSALEQIQFNRKHEIVYSQLRLAIMSGQFEPGQRLKLRELAASLGTSPMPVRDALGRLVAEQALERVGTGAVSIPLVTKSLFREVMEVRALLEGEAAARAAKLMPFTAVELIRPVAAQLTAATKSRDILQYLKLNQSLKFGIYENCGSSVLRGAIESLWLRAGPFLRYLAHDLEGLVAINFHDAALDAIVARNSERTRDAISRDILAGMEFLLAHAQFDEEQAS